MTTFSAMAFWRELLQKNINAGVLQEKGSQISQNYEIIQDISAKLLAIYPNEIKFHFRYGNFLLHIIHNEYDALECFRKAYSVYQMKVQKKGNAMPINEQTIFGENTASAIVIMSANSTNIGVIEQTNEEMEQVLGYKAKDLIGNNVRQLIPKPIAIQHDRLVQRYFETAQPHVIEIKRYLLATSKEGYLKEVELVVKVYPRVNEKIVFVGFIQRTDNFHDIEPPKQDFDKLERNYIITDDEGNISNVTEGLLFEMGLHAKFFQYADSIFAVKFHITQICAEIADPDIIETLENGGEVLEVDTSNILANIELEQLSSEEVQDVRVSLGRYKVYIQLKRLTISSYCKINIYRFIVLGRSDQVGFGGGMGGVNSMMVVQEEAKTDEDDKAGSGVVDGTAYQASTQNSQSSMDSNGSNFTQFNRIIKDFKKALGERKTPSNLLLLNRIMVSILFTTIILSSVDFGLLTADIGTQLQRQECNIMNEQRTLKFIQLASNTRSYINIANGLEFDRYDGIPLQPVDRFDYLSRLIQSQASDLQEIHEYITKLRALGIVKKESSYEYEQINIFRLDDSNQASSYQQPFRVALQTYINTIQFINETDRSLLALPSDLVQIPPVIGQVIKASKSTTSDQKAAYFLLVNGLREILGRAEETIDFMHREFEESDVQSPFMIIMIIGVIMTLISFGALFHQLLTIERNKAEILSLYALIPIPDIQKVFNSCDEFMETLNVGSLTSQLQLGINKQSLTEMRSQGEFAHSSWDAMGSGMIDKRASIMNEKDLVGSTDSLQFGQGIKPIKRMSEDITESDDEMEQNRRLLNQITRVQEKKKSKAMKNNANYWGIEIYGEMIKNTLIQIRQLNNQEDKQKEESNKMRRLNREHRNKGSIVEARNSLLPSDFEKGQEAAENQPQHDAFNENGFVKKQTKAAESQPTQKQKGGKRRKPRGTSNHKKIRFEKGDPSNDLDIDASANQNVSKVIDESKDGLYENEGQHGHEESNDIDDADHDQPHHHHHSHKDSTKSRISQRFVLSASHGKLDERQKYFYKTIKPQNWGKIAITLVIGAIFIAYFAQLMAYHLDFKSQLQTLEDSIPFFLNRFKQSMLGYAFLRERVIYHNSLLSFEESGFSPDLDIVSIETSMMNEQTLTSLKNNYKAILNDMVSLSNTLDSELLCSKIIGITSYNSQLQTSTAPNAQVNLTQERPYESIVQSIVPLFRAAQSGNVTMLKALRQKGTDMFQINYDRRNALHFAVKSGSLESVKFLLSIGLNPNQTDRWGATAIQYTEKNSEIYTILRDQGAQYGRDQGDYQLLASVYEHESLKNDDERAFYAAYYDNIEALQYLAAIKTLNIEAFDRDGRSVLSIAASQGNLKSVKYLVSLGANPSIRDARNNDALRDAAREGRTQVAAYLKGIIDDRVVQNYCSDFSEGLLRKGLQQAIGNFHKRFADLQIKIQVAQSYQAQLQLLSPRNSSITDDQYNGQSLKMFFSTQELYYGPMIDSTVAAIKDTYTKYISAYSSISQTIFFLFLTIQVIMLVFLRGKLIETMKEDIFQSRGILNLIPDSFFLENKEKVEKLIKTLKD